MSDHTTTSESAGLFGAELSELMPALMPAAAHGHVELALAEWLRNQAAAHQTATPIDEDVPVYTRVVPDGFKLHVHDLVALGFAEKPLLSVKASPTFDVPESFSRYVGEFDGPNGSVRLYADVTTAKVVAILDDNLPTTPGRRQHTATLQLRPTEAWQRWHTSNGRLMAQEEFAEFIETGVEQIASPPAAVLIEVAETFHATTDAKFSSAVKRINGQVQLSYVEEITTTAGKDGKATIPTDWQLVLPVYEGTEAIGLTARFRYRVSGGRLTLGYSLLNPQDAIRQAFESVLEGIEAQTTRRPLGGRP